MTKTMLICSTNNQVVNLVPAITEKVDKIIIFTTEHAKKVGWTKNLIPILKKRNFHVNDVPVSDETESNVQLFTELIKKEMKKVEENEILLNVGGGQKTFTMAMMKAYADLPDANSKVVYTEANKKLLFFISKEMKTTSKPYKIDLGLEEIIRLYGYSFFNKSKTKNPNFNATKSFSKEYYKKQSPAAITLKYLKKEKSLLQEIFYRCIMNESHEPVERNNMEDSIKKKLEEIKPSLQDLDIKYDMGYSPEEIKIKIKELKKKPHGIDSALKLLENVYADFVYDKFWNAVKKEIIKNVKNELYINNVKVRQNPYSTKEQDELKQIFKDIRGNAEIKFDDNGFLRNNNVKFDKKYGDLFEEMVFTEVLELQDKECWQNIHEIWLNVFTQKGFDEKDATPEAEYDIVIVTKFGTLILIESKSAKFDNKVAKGQERDAFQKSGPYGKAVIAGPLLKNIKSVTDKKEIEKKYPFISNALIAQAEKVERAGMKYWCIDEIAEKLEKGLR